MANKAVLDTTIIRLILDLDSEPLKSDYYWEIIKNCEWFIPFVVYGELYAWAHRYGMPQEKLKKINNILRRTKVVTFDKDIANNYGRTICFIEDKKMKSKNYQNDAWIAACASSNDVFLVSDDNFFLHLEKHINIAPSYKNTIITLA